MGAADRTLGVIDELGVFVGVIDGLAVFDGVCDGVVDCVVDGVVVVVLDGDTDGEAPVESDGVGDGVGDGLGNTQLLITMLPATPLAPAAVELGGNHVALFESARVGLTKELPPPPPA